MQIGEDYCTVVGSKLILHRGGDCIPLLHLYLDLKDDFSDDSVGSVLVGILVLLCRGFDLEGFLGHCHHCSRL